MPKHQKLQEAEDLTIAIRERLAAQSAQPSPEPAVPAAAPAVQLQPAAPAVPAPTPASIAQPEIAELTRRFEARIESMNGRVRKAEGERQKLQERNDALEKQVAELTKRLNDASAEAPDDLTQHYTPDQIAGIGEESLRLTLSTARREAKKLLDAQVATAVAPLQQQMAKDAEERQTERDQEHAKRYDAFIAALKVRVPDFRVIDTDPRFLVWLDVVDAPSGYKRLQILHDAETRMNVDVAAGLFSSFLKEQGVTQVHQPNPAPLPAGQAPAGGGGPVVTQVEGVSRAEIVRFQTDYAQGKYRHRKAEAEAFKQRIDAAIAAGAVR